MRLPWAETGSSCTEKLEEGTCTEKLEKGTSSSSSSNPRFSNLNTTVTRNATVARFSDYSNYHTQLKERQKSTIMNISETQNKLGDYMKAKLMGNNLKLIKESENELKRAGGKLHKY